MPCPFFEPQEAVEPRTHVNARLPLMAEYTGACHAQPDAPVPIPQGMRFGCNHGYSQGKCKCFPVGTAISALRYSVLSSNGAVLDLVCIEESGYAPLKWHSLRYEVAIEAIEPEVASKCMAAQALAFCRNYLNVNE